LFPARRQFQAAVLALLCATGLTVEAHAAATVKKFSLVLSAIPTSIKAGGYNDLINNINETALEPRGLQGLDTIDFGWLFEAQLRYFVRQNIAVSAGVGQLRSTTSREYLPAIDSSIQLFGEVITVPINIGAAYYLTPYNQGDFQARTYFGAGFTSSVHNRAKFQQTIVGIEGVPPEVAFIDLTGTQDAPGYYVEVGGHMFFASRWSVMISGLYRSAVISNLQEINTGQPFLAPDGNAMELDMGGLGLRFGVALGF
jgi:hypothetical protein